MKQMKIEENSFSVSMEKMLQNTLNFENSSVYTRYVTEEGIKGNTSVLDLFMMDNVVLDTIVPYLKSISNVKIYNEADEFKYRNRPMKLSKDIYGYIDYWYILLAVNNFNNPYEFKGFKRLYIPSQGSIEDLINVIFYKNKKIGVSKISD